MITGPLAGGKVFFDPGASCTSGEMSPDGSKANRNVQAFRPGSSPAWKKNFLSQQTLLISTIPEVMEAAWVGCSRRATGKLFFTAVCVLLLYEYN